MVLRPSGDYGGGYAECFPRNGGGGGNHFYESVKSETESFRLRGDICAETVDPTTFNDETSSIASKKRIDSMFKRSTGRAASTTAAGGGCGNDENGRPSGGSGYSGYGFGGDGNKNTVQEKIEKMFAEISSSSELDTDVSMDSAAAVGSNKYHVQYIGCAELSAKISSLEGLQQPVRDMYFEYRLNGHRDNNDDDDEGDRTTGTRRDFSGLLEISTAGLTIRYRDVAGETVHRTDPFPSIAVWAALKYVCRRRSPPPQRKATTAATTVAAVIPSGSLAGYEYAFLPLIADPDGSDKAPLFRDMDLSHRVRLDAAGDHAPVFAVVTRKADKRLECHGFACETESDALLMAANLYGALVAAMSSAAAAAAATATAASPLANNDDGTVAVPSTRRVIRQRNGFTSMSSTAGSSVGDGDVAPTLPPPRPPRRNKPTASSATSSADGGSNGTWSIRTAVDDGDVCSDAKTFRMTVKQPPSLRRGVCNSGSSVTTDVRSSVGNDAPGPRPDRGVGGDIFTKVVIPRSGSFLNTNGLASSKYSRRTAGSGIETAAADRVRRRSNGSGVMGFSDMFNELRVQEGLTNMDDILRAIIDVEGMSYNDLKPVYKEFLTKLAMTLTKDELYQRTKAIMAEQKRKRNKRRPFGPSVAKSRGGRLNDKLRDAFDLRAAKSRIGSVLLPDFCKRPKRTPAKCRTASRGWCSCSGAGSSIEFRPVDRHNKRGRVAASPVCSTSDDSDFFAAAALRRQRQRVKLQQQRQQLLRRQQPYRKSKTRGTEDGRQLHQASSGYFSCSECSAGAAGGKCYCCDGAEPTLSLVSCSCDSDSCADSDKCYCGRPRRPRNIFDELKSRGFAASESSASRADSPGTAWKKNELLLTQHRHDDDDDDDNFPGGSSSAATGGQGGIESSKSLEYLQMVRRPVGRQNRLGVAKPVTVDGTSVTMADMMSSSSSSSLSAATVYTSSSARRRQRDRSGSSSSDNFRAIDYALFATAGLKSRGAQNRYRAGCPTTTTTDHHGTRRPSTAAATMNKRSYSSDTVHLTGGCRVYHQYRQQPAARRHSVHDGGFADDGASFFKSAIENSLGYYP